MKAKVKSLEEIKQELILSDSDVYIGYQGRTGVVFLNSMVNFCGKALSFKRAFDQVNEIVRYRDEKSGCLFFAEWLHFDSLEQELDFMVGIERGDSV